MKYKARYKDIEFDAIYSSEDSVNLKTSNRNYLDMRFKEKINALGKKVYIKNVMIKDLDELYEITEYVTWHDKDFLVFGETEDTYTLYYSYMDMDKTGDMLGFCRYYDFETYDKNVYVKSVPKKEITNYRVEKEDLLK